MARYHIPCQRRATHLAVTVQSVLVQPDYRQAKTIDSKMDFRSIACDTYADFFIRFAACTRAMLIA